MEEINALKTAELISNGLAIPTILMSLCVVFIWLKPAFHSLKNRRIDSTEEWFIVGVFLGFIGETLDNIYWTIAWTFQYLEMPSAEHWMAHGVLANIPFRQFLGIVAAYCHVRSAMSYNKNSEHSDLFNYLLLVSILFGFLYSISLVFIKHL